MNSLKFLFTKGPFLLSLYWQLGRSSIVIQTHNHHFATMFVVWLFIAMGLPWTLDLVSGYLHDRENDAIILLIDMVTALQGFMIFLIYNLKFGLWNKLVGFLKMRRKLMEKNVQQEAHSSDLWPKHGYFAAQLKSWIMLMFSSCREVGAIFKSKVPS